MPDGDERASGEKRSRFVAGFLAGVVVAGLVMGFFWHSHVSKKDDLIQSLNMQISERDGTIQTLRSQLEGQSRN